MNIYSKFHFDNTIVRYPLDLETGTIGLEIIPEQLNESIPVHRKNLLGEYYIDALPDPESATAFKIDSLVQLKIIGDAYTRGCGHGHTLRNSATLPRFRFHSQSTASRNGRTTIQTVLLDNSGCRIDHFLTHASGIPTFQIHTSFTNGSTQEVKLEMLSSFCLSGITPFDPNDAPRRLFVHRFRSGWSAEGRLDTASIESLHLERSWSGYTPFSERFGQVGTMPVRKWFPFVSIEDVQAGVCWGARLSWAGSWQMEVFRMYDSLSISGGLADREFGHWVKTISPGEIFSTPFADIACAKGSIDDLCDLFRPSLRANCAQHPEIENSLPIVYNEWCASWGSPTHDSVVAAAKQLKGSPVTYLVIDAGWYQNGTSPWSESHGDWIPSSDLFPGSLQSTAQVIREHGLIPGLWFEIETCGKSSAAFSLVDRLLKRDNLPITAGERRFWDVSKSAVRDYLSDMVIEMLQNGGFGYLKVDYNESLGIGCDHSDSQGEGLREVVCGVYQLFDQIREALPELVIENCSSGGHRLEPSMMSRCAISSSSDAHELPEIPIISANLHRLVLPRQSLVWAVLHKTDSEQRMLYSLAATFLGRMCISGKIQDLSTEQWKIAVDTMRLYQDCREVIKTGTSRLQGSIIDSWRHPLGWQALLMESHEQLLIVFHSFEVSQDQVRIQLPDGNWQLHRSLNRAHNIPSIGKNEVLIKGPNSWSANVILLNRCIE